MYKLCFASSLRPNKRRHLTRTLITPLVVFIAMASLVVNPALVLAKEIPQELPYPAPTLLSPANGSDTLQTKPLITGLAKNDSLVKVFIDGKLNGQFDVKNHASGTANFAYTPFLHLKPGVHEVFATATDVKGKQSPHSNRLRFMVEYPMPAPTLIETVTNAATTAARPWIVGFSKNDTVVRIYIDGRDDGEFMVQNSSTGTADFAYRTLYNLKPGQHTTYAVAIDRQGKESHYSDIITFTVPKPAPVQESTAQPKPEVKGDETQPAGQTNTNTNGNSNSNGNSNGNDNTNAAAGATNTNSTSGTNTEDNGNWPVVVGALVLAVVLIIVIDSLIRKRRKTDPGTQETLFGPLAPPGPDKEKKEPAASQLFPPPPPDIR